jgi:hypothetical protein
LKKIEAEQTRALESINSAQDYPGKMKAMNDQIRSMREQYKELLAKQSADEKALKQQHKRVIDLEEKCRKMKSAIAASARTKHPDPDEPTVPTITEAEIEEFKAKCRAEEQAKLEEEKALKA